MKIRKSHCERVSQSACVNPGKSTVNQAACVGPMARTVLFCAALAATSLANAQDTIAMVDHSAAGVSSQAVPVSVSAVQALDNTAASQTASSKEQDSKSPITGLEPGTLALIGFGLLALAATRRNAR